MSDKAPLNAKILVVDDEEANVRLLERLLSQAGYTNVRSTRDSHRVVALYTEFQPDLILLDLHMPHPDGFELLEEFQRLIPEGSYVPVLVLTADVTGGALRRALLAGAKDFLTKPFDAQEVVLRIRNLLQTLSAFCPAVSEPGARGAGAGTHAASAPDGKVVGHGSVAGGRRP